MSGAFAPARNLVSRGTRRLLSRLRSPRQPDVARAAATWNAEYESGRWEYLEQLPELSRYSVLVGYMSHFRPAGSVLDVGCGSGVLYRRIPPHARARYVGVDLSSSAVANLQKLHDERSAFCAADGEHYVPTERFDIIVFNEVLYFFKEPRAAVERYARTLNDGGVLLVSTCTAFRGGTAILNGLKSALNVLDETCVTHGANKWSWIVTALAPDSYEP